MFVKDITEQAILVTNARYGDAPIASDYLEYFSRYDATNVLILTDENIDGDLRVLHQVFALRKISKNLRVLYVQPQNSYSYTEKKWIELQTLKTNIKNLLLLLNFLSIIKKHRIQLPWTAKSKQGLYHDNEFLIKVGIDVSQYSMVVLNNLISVNAINFKQEDSHKYVYDIHEFEVFRNRKTQSLQRSFLLYIREREVLSKIDKCLTISHNNIHLLCELYNIPSNKISCIYNRNFNSIDLNLHKKFTEKQKNNSILLIYIGNVNFSRGLDIISKLSHDYNILIIACTHNDDAVDFVKNTGNQDNIFLHLGMNYDDVLLKLIDQHLYCYFLIPIHDGNFSYKNALPNKFFQAQALGLPIIVLPDTYLESLVKKYQIGLILDNNMDIRTVSWDGYITMCQSMTNMEIQLNNGII